MKSWATKVIPALLVVGCTDLQAVRSVSGELSKASASWDEVYDELAASCARQQQFAKIDVGCSSYTDQIKRLHNANGVLAGYFVALGHLAGADTFTLDDKITAIAAEAGKIPGVDADQPKAVGELAGIVVKALSERAREGALKRAIENGAPPAQRIVRGLQALLPDSIRRQLDAEQQVTRTEFGRLLSNVRLLGAPATAADVCNPPQATAHYSSGSDFLLVQDYCTRLARIKSERAALERYRMSLGKADEALNSLAKSRSQLGARATANSLLKIGAQLQESVSHVTKAFEAGKSA